MDPFVSSPTIVSDSSGIIDGVLVFSAFLGAILLDITKGGVKWYIAIANALKKGLNGR
jgi:hypothetical protein